MTTAIWWIRRDLRVEQNVALDMALHAASTVIPLFIIDPLLLSSRFFSERRFEFLLANLQELRSTLGRLSSGLVIRSGKPLDVLTGILAETQADLVFAERDHSPYAVHRDTVIQGVLPLKLVGSPAVLPPGAVLKKDGTPYTVFTPFSRAWLTQLSSRGIPTIIQPALIPGPPEPLRSDPIPDIQSSGVLMHFPPGAMEANRRLHEFIKSGITAYGETRDRIDLDATSHLSPYLRLGVLSAEIAAQAALRIRGSLRDPLLKQSADAWLNELIWRDFYIHILHHFPRVMKNNFRLIALRWLDDPRGLSAWQNGETGYPVVDAAMHCLRSTGWMPNRARMITASFLTKHLLIDWRYGEMWFMQQLVDGDPAANNGGWQWTAGTGTDAAPFFRIFNPVLQSEKFDPSGLFIRKWIPALRDVPAAVIHQPWKMSIAEQHKARCTIGVDYPAPIIEHQFARQRALAAYHKTQ